MPCTQQSFLRNAKNGLPCIKNSESSVIKTLGEIQVCSLIAANARVNAVESCRLLKMNAAGNPSLLSSKTNSVTKSNPYAFIPCVKSSI
ncbi:hypothetical protein TNCV_2860821 [Trichonephila clavipes]|nr:hypothetical protein TNCV_2860821 [Trichonephila clavipes]